MKKKTGSGRTEEQLQAGIDKANTLIRDLACRDDVDTSLYGFMIRKAGEKSLSLHRGLHPSEDNPCAASGARDPRLPTAQVGLSMSGALKTDLRQDIEARHRELVHLHRWYEGIGNRPVVASDFRWDPVMLALLRVQGIDLDALVTRGPGEFVSRSASRDYPSVTHVVDTMTDDRTDYLGCVDGDTVRALQIRYDKGIFYSWRRTQPAHVELLVQDRPFPETVMNGLRGVPFNTVVDHSSLAHANVDGYARTGSTISFKSASRLVRP